MKTIVTGGLGFVGRHFVRRLVDDGHEVTVVDNMSSGIRPDRWMYLPDKGAFAFKFHYGDIRQYVTRYPADEFDLIVHCAAVVGGRIKIDGDPLAVATDLAIDADLFNWIARSKNRKQKLIYFSSSAVYPTYLQTNGYNRKLAESMLRFATAKQIGVPDQTYGFAKLAGEFLARQAADRYGIDVVIYRPFSGYGEDQALDYPFPSIIKRVAEREDPITVWGSGDQTRDFIHIDDVVGAVISTMHKIGSGEALNLGRGDGVSFKQLANLTCFEAGHNAKIVNDPTKPEGVYARVADCTLLNQLYETKIKLVDGVRRALDRYRIPI